MTLETLTKLGHVFDSTYLLAESGSCIIRDNGLTERHSNTTGPVENLLVAALVS